MGFKSGENNGQAICLISSRDISSYVHCVVWLGAPSLSQYLAAMMEPQLFSQTKRRTFLWLKDRPPDHPVSLSCNQSGDTIHMKYLISLESHYCFDSPQNLTQILYGPWKVLFCLPFLSPHMQLTRGGLSYARRRSFPRTNNSFDHILNHLPMLKFYPSKLNVTDLTTSPR